MQSTVTLKTAEQRGRQRVFSLEYVKNFEMEDENRRITNLLLWIQTIISRSRTGSHERKSRFITCDQGRKRLTLRSKPLTHLLFCSLCFTSTIPLALNSLLLHLVSTLSIPSSRGKRFFLSWRWFLVRTGSWKVKQQFVFFVLGNVNVGLFSYLVGFSICNESESNTHSGPETRNAKGAVSRITFIVGGK